MYDYYAFYEVARDNSQAAKDLFRALKITGQVDMFHGADGYLSFSLPEAVATGTVINFFSLFRPSKNDDLGEVSFVVVGPPEIDYGQDLGLGLWKTRLEFHNTNLTPEDLKYFLDEMFKKINGFSKDEIKSATKNFLG
ncbi:hypothetical protein KKE14_00445 [Patescibacteria group bacterium]|nr:hypothetical protein [Patescibacteria group bacterium]